MSIHTKSSKIRVAQRFIKQGGSQRIAKELGVNNRMIRYWGDQRFQNYQL